MADDLIFAFSFDLIHAELMAQIIFHLNNLVILIIWPLIILESQAI